MRPLGMLLVGGTGSRTRRVIRTASCMPILSSHTGDRQSMIKVFGALGVLVFALSVPRLAVAQDPSTYSWSVNPPNVASVSWTNPQLADFVNAVTDWAVSVRVGGFQFVDLDQDGQLELLVSADF